MAIERVGVVGAGVMGSGIAQVLATAGYEAICTDVSDEALEAAQTAVRAGRYGVERGVERGKMSESDAEAALARLTFTAHLADLADADLVIECIPEKLELKTELFEKLDGIVKSDAILASNSSGLPIEAMAAATYRPDLVIGWHWASPPVVMKFAEIVVTAKTREEVTRQVCEAAERCEKNPVVVRDHPPEWGYVANRIYFGMIKEAQRVVDDGVATEAQVNQLMVDCYRWPVGPFAMVKGATEGWK
jgi:3-hydroxybutyryl-CoA dehydrogenase